jgi:hypothetical protein
VERHLRRYHRDVARRLRMIHEYLHYVQPADFSLLLNAMEVAPSRWKRAEDAMTEATRSESYCCPCSNGHEESEVTFPLGQLAGPRGITGELIAPEVGEAVINHGMPGILPAAARERDVTMSEEEFYAFTVDGKRRSAQGVEYLVVWDLYPRWAASWTSINDDIAAACQEYDRKHAGEPVEETLTPRAAVPSGHARRSAGPFPMAEAPPRTAVIEMPVPDPAPVVRGWTGERIVNEAHPDQPPPARRRQIDPQELGRLPYQGTRRQLQLREDADRRRQAEIRLRELLEQQGPGPPGTAPEEPPAPKRRRIQESDDD